ncbi:MAG TPA: ATP-binding protein [Bacteroidota bacterium]|nr:ATP-binding protein [Bacteroidota bacterium]
MKHRFSPSQFQRESSDLLELEVSDTSIGIPQERLADILDAFQQVDGGFSRKYEGLGLGLTI